MWPEGAVLVPVDAKVQDANNKHTQIMVSESKKKTVGNMTEDEKVTWGHPGTGTGRLDHDECPSLLSAP